jgi:3-oxoacyl-[acyl-carrier protein] reductase
MALILRVNVLGPMLVCKYAVLVMEGQKSGSIINMTSGAGTSRGAGRSSYAISKAALNQLTYSLAAEEKPFNIAVNALDPGGLITEGSKSTHPVDYERWAAGRDPVEAIVPPAVALALKDGSSMTGQVVKRVEFGKAWK